VISVGSLLALAAGPVAELVAELGAGVAV